MRQSVSLQRNWFGCIQEQKLVEPSLYLIVEGISDGIGHGYFFEFFEVVQLAASFCISVSDLFNQFERQGSSGTLVAIDGAGHEEMMGSKESFNVGQRDCCSLVDDYEIGVSYFIGIVGEDELDELGMVSEYIYSDYGFVVFFVGAVYSVEILSFFVLEQFEAQADKFEESFEVVGGGGCHEYIAETQLNGGCEGQSD